MSSGFQQRTVLAHWAVQAQTFRTAHFWRQVCEKNLVALAALAATGATLAQSSVTVYGRLELGMSSVDTTVGTTPATDAFSLAGDQDRWTGSRLGFRGSEDLGGGLRAGFTYEMGINADRNTPAGISPADNARTRLANLSLSGGFGTFVVGTFMNAFYTARGFSPANNTIPGGQFTQWQALPGSERFDGRSQNSFAYVAPAVNGFTFSFGGGSEESGTALKFTGYTLNLNFTRGPLAAQFAFGDLDMDFPVVADMQNWALGVRYNFGPVVASFIYEDSQRDVAGLRTFDAQSWEIGARFPMGALAPYITFGQGERNTDDVDGWQIGTTYNLSRRTWIYAAVGEAQRESATGINVRKESGYAIGLVHTF